ncbi:MAG: hypothetical protein ABW187_04905 [Dokdonella sp.]
MVNPPLRNSPASATTEWLGQSRIAKTAATSAIRGTTIEATLRRFHLAEAKRIFAETPGVWPFAGSRSLGGAVAPAGSRAAFSSGIVAGGADASGSSARTHR